MAEYYELEFNAELENGSTINLTQRFPNRESAQTWVDIFTAADREVMMRKTVEHYEEDVEVIATHGFGSFGVEE